MVALRTGRWPKLPVLNSVLLIARLGVIGPVVLIAGCASDKPSHVAAPMAQDAAPSQKVEMEGDGAPVQPPPARAMRAEEDDPTQPWSPNYGNGATTSSPQSAPNSRLPRQVEASAAQAGLHAAYGSDAPRSTGTLTTLSNRDADAVIAQAISAQEMRRQ